MMVTGIMEAKQEQQQFMTDISEWQNLHCDDVSHLPGWWTDTQYIVLQLMNYAIYYLLEKAV